jgi:hypothetical protein
MLAALFLPINSITPTAFPEADAGSLGMHGTIRDAIHIPEVEKSLENYVRWMVTRLISTRVQRVAFVPRNEKSPAGLLMTALADHESPSNRCR